MARRLMPRRDRGSTDDIPELLKAEASWFHDTPPSSGVRTSRCAGESMSAMAKRSGSLSLSEDGVAETGLVIFGSSFCESCCTLEASFVTGLSWSLSSRSTGMDSAPVVIPVCTSADLFFLSSNWNPFSLFFVADEIATEALTTGLSSSRGLSAPSRGPLYVLLRDHCPLGLF